MFFDILTQHNNIKRISLSLNDKENLNSFVQMTNIYYFLICICIGISNDICETCTPWPVTQWQQSTTLIMWESVVRIHPGQQIWAGVPSGLGPGLQNHVDGFDSHTALYILYLPLQHNWQLHLTCNEDVVGSSPTRGSKKCK